MPNVKNKQPATFIGTMFDDLIVGGFVSTTGDVLAHAPVEALSGNGLEGDDTILTGSGNDLAAGDMVGAEWSFVNGRWVFDASKIVVSTYGETQSFNDVIETGDGDDVLLGNGGHDVLRAGAGDDLINTGRGDDRAFGGVGNDILNLEAGDDYAEAGAGNDIVNGGDGNDVIFGDLAGDNLLTVAETATSFGQLAAGGGWTMTDDFGGSVISQSAQTQAGETYTIAFELAANLSAGRSSATVEVLWNGEVVDTVQTQSGAYQGFEVDVTSGGEQGELSFRTVDVESASGYNFDGPIVSYDKTMSIGGEPVTVQGFAAGQAKLYQVIDGQLNVFDIAEQDYVAVGTVPSFKVNATGFNIEDDMIYGVAKSNGVDALGQAVSNTDIVMIDAAGDTYRVGEGFYGDYVGDFDDKGNLWTFHTSMNRISVVDVDNLDADGNPQITYLHFPTEMFTDRTFDLAFNAAEQAFYAVVSPARNGGEGKVVRIDLSDALEGGEPTFKELPITGTLYGDDMAVGMANGAYGAVFMDGDGNLYYGLNRGDHDLDASTDVTGGIFKVNMDWSDGVAYAEFMSEAPATGSNDGAVDPRSADAFAEIDADAAVLLRKPTLTLVEGGNDTLRGGTGDDEIHGNDGSDDISGGSGADSLYGDQGDDLISAGEDDDLLVGGVGNDKLRGEAGDDMIFGGAGNDFVDGGSGDDLLVGGAGTDKMVGGTGSDTIESGAGNDHLWGGNWSKDDTADTFVFASGSGKDFVHDFEAEHDVLDLTAFGTALEDVRATAQDQGWATILNLSALDDGAAGDTVILKGVSLSDLDADSFLF